MCQNRKWCIDVFGPTAQRAILVSSRGTPAVLFLSSFCFVFFLSFQVPPQLLASSSFFLLSSTSVLFPKTENPWSPLLRSWWDPPLTYLYSCADWVVVAKHWAPVLPALHPQPSPPGCLLCCPWPILYGDESEFHHHRLVDGRWSLRQRPLGGAALMSVCSRKRGFASEEEHKPNDYLQE